MPDYIAFPLTLAPVAVYLIHGTYGIACNINDKVFGKSKLSNVITIPVSFILCVFLYIAVFFVFLIGVCIASSILGKLSAILDNLMGKSKK